MPVLTARAIPTRFSTARKTQIDNLGVDYFEVPVNRGRAGKVDGVVKRVAAVDLQCTTRAEYEAHILDTVKVGVDPDQRALATNEIRPCSAAIDPVGAWAAF